MLLYGCVAALFISTSLGLYYQPEVVDISCGTRQEAHIEYKPGWGWLSADVSLKNNFIYGILKENLRITGSGNCYEHFFTIRLYRYD